jgi:hypothetical protein
MKKFIFLSYGYKTPTPEIMGAWGKWFASIAERIVEQEGLGSGRESRMTEPKNYHETLERQLATLSSTQKALKKQKKLPRAALLSQVM